MRQRKEGKVIDRETYRRESKWGDGKKRGKGRKPLFNRGWNKNIPLPISAMPDSGPDFSQLMSYGFSLVVTGVMSAQRS